MYQCDLPWTSLDSITVFMVLASVNTSVAVTAPFTVWGSQALGSIGLNSIKGPEFFWFGPTKPVAFQDSCWKGIIFSESHNNPWRQFLFGTSILPLGGRSQTPQG